MQWECTQGASSTVCTVENFAMMFSGDAIIIGLLVMLIIISIWHRN